MVNGWTDTRYLTDVYRETTYFVGRDGATSADVMVDEMDDHHPPFFFKAIAHFW